MFLALLQFALLTIQNSKEIYVYIYNLVFIFLHTTDFRGVRQSVRQSVRLSQVLIFELKLETLSKSQKVWHLFTRKCSTEIKIALHSYFLIRTCYYFLRLSVLISMAIRGSNCSLDVHIFPIVNLYENVLLSGLWSLIAKQIKFKYKADWSQPLQLHNHNSFCLLQFLN